MAGAWSYSATSTLAAEPTHGGTSRTRDPYHSPASASCLRATSALRNLWDRLFDAGRDLPPRLCPRPGYRRSAHSGYAEDGIGWLSCVQHRDRHEPFGSQSLENRRRGHREEDSHPEGSSETGRPIGSLCQPRKAHEGTPLETETL